MKKILAVLATVLFILCIAGSVTAMPLTLDKADLSGWGVGISKSRGILFRAEKSFEISSASLFGDIGLTSYNLDIYASTGPENYGQLLTTSSAILGGTGIEYHQIDISYTFAADSYYFMNWARTDGLFIDGSLRYFENSSLPIDYGVLTLLDGTSGTCVTNDDSIQFDNGAHAQFSMEIENTPVPEPATLVLMGFGLIGFAGIRRKKLKK